MQFHNILIENKLLEKKEHSIKERLIAPFILATISIFMWFITIPIWDDFIEVIMNNKNYEIITNIALVSIGFYVIFAYNNIIDKLFLGSGKAHMLFLQSFITNIVVFIPYYYLVSIEKLEDIAIMIGIAMSFDAILTFAMFFYYVKKFEFSDKKIVHV